jgi:hypothetical protein
VQCTLYSPFSCKVVIIVVDFYCLSVRESGYSKRFLSPWITIPRTIRENHWGSQTCVSYIGPSLPYRYQFSASCLSRPRLENTQQAGVQVWWVLRFSRIWPWDCILFPFLILFLVYMSISISHYILQGSICNDWTVLTIRVKYCVPSQYHYFAIFKKF